MKVSALFSLSALLAREANSLPPLADKSTVPECRIPDKPKILEFGSPPTGSPINYGTPSPLTVSSTPPTKPPTNAPTVQPTNRPTKTPSHGPTTTPTEAPTQKPSTSPTKKPSSSPTKKPSTAPTKKPTKAPTKRPTKAPSKRPTKAPSKKPTKIPSKKPTKAPTKRPSTAPTKAPTTKGPTKAPTTKPTLKPTKAPTNAPVASPASFCISGEVSLLEQYGGIAYSKIPITVTPGSQTGTTVTVSIEQVWKAKSVSWISTRFTDPHFGATVCPKKNEVGPGLVDYSAGSRGDYELKNYDKTYGTSLTAACENNVATIEVFVHDGQFKGETDLPVPSECSPSNDRGKKIGYKFSVPCDVCVSGGTPLFQPPTAAPTPQSQSPTTAPTPLSQAPTKAPQQIVRTRGRVPR